MSEVKLKEKMELWEPGEYTLRVKPNSREEPQLCVKQEPEEFPFHLVTVKTEDEDQSLVPLQRPAEESRREAQQVEENMEELDGEDEGAGENCSSDPLTDGSEDSFHWNHSAASSTDLDLDFSAGPIRAKGKPCSCTVCGKEFLRCGDLNRHLLIHTEHKPFECVVCGRCFRRKNTLKTHMLVHTGEKPFFCSVCEKGFAYKQTFDRHRCIPPAVEAMRPYSCSDCGRRFLSSSNLKTHMFVHTDERPQKCQVCETVFKHKSSLERHLKVQHNILSNPKKPFVPKPPEPPEELKTPHKCSECGKEFPRKYCLKRHVMSHSGEKPCSCPVCGLRLASKTNVKIHMATHSTDKPFRCPFCDKGFTQDSSMRRHMVVHTLNSAGSTVPSPAANSTTGSDDSTPAPCGDDVSEP